MRNLLVSLSLTAATLLGGATAYASPDTQVTDPARRAAGTEIEIRTPDQARAVLDHQLADAVLAERQAGARVYYYEQATRIAERDLDTAQTRAVTAERNWDAAVKRHDHDAAGVWAPRHAKALAEEREAMGRATLARAERDTARLDFQARAEDLHQIATRAGRIKHPGSRNQRG